MTKPDAYGPIDVIVIEFPSGADGDNTAAALGDLVDSETKCSGVRSTRRTISALVTLPLITCGRSWVTMSSVDERMRS